LASRNISIGLFSFNKAEFQWYNGHENIQILFQPSNKISGKKISEKLSYFKYLPILKKILRDYKPDILHAHYASSYGLLGALSGFHPFIISVWGSDVYDFPKKGKIHDSLLRFSLSRANVITSTSNCMKKVTSQFTKKSIDVIPFGIDITKFNPDKRAELHFERKGIVLGIIKSLEDKYGIDTLLNSFHLINSKYPEINAKLLIVGDGSKRLEYEKLAISYSLYEKVFFTGKIPHDKISEFHNNIDVFISLSKLDSESFGVSLVEAMASGSIVIASRVDGFIEVLQEGQINGFLVDRNSPGQVLKVFDIIMNEHDKIDVMRKMARKRVLQYFDWNRNLDDMTLLYYKVLNDKK
jgi:glycosyltransferase involved in cell wall biosynthesis